MRKILLVIMLSGLMLSACSQSTTGNLDNQQNPVAMGTAPISYPGTVSGYVPGVSSGNKYYYLDISPGAAYTLNVPTSSAIDVYVYDKPFTDPTATSLCQWFGSVNTSSSSSPTAPHCSLTATQTQTLSRVYILISNWSGSSVSFTLDIT